MRTTIEFDDDTAVAVEALRRESGLGASAATNQLIRRGLMAPPPTSTFVPRSRKLGIQIDVSNIAEAIDILEGHEAR